MSTTVKIDTLIQIYSSAINGPTVGSLSKYSTLPNPGTNKTIDGFGWDVRTWPTDEELEAVSFAPSIWDPNSDFIPPEDFQSGIGDNQDLLLIDIERQEAENKELWVPKVKHGYFYINNEEWYLFSDDYQEQQFNKLQTYSGLQYVDLKYDPKIGIPIQARRYSYNSITGRYTIDLSLRKKVEFTGIKVNGIEQDTVDSNGIVLLSNIDNTKEEFIVSNHFGDPPRILLNRNYSEDVGGNITLTTSGTVATGSLDTLELLGISDGLSSEYRSQFSPIDPSGIVDLWVWKDTTNPVKWTNISPFSNFTSSGATEYKLDSNLGIISFGNFDGDTTESGALGLIPTKGSKIGLRYTKGLQVEYEPINSRDYLYAKDADTNPLHNSSEKGFIKLLTQIVDPAQVSLRADLPIQFGTSSYQVDAGNVSGQIIATVTDTEGDTIEGIEVFFEIIQPFIGTFTNGELTTSAITNIDGEATAFFAPPTSIDSLGKPTVDVSYDSLANTTTINVDGIAAPNTVSGVFLFQVKKSDPILGIPDTSVNSFYSGFFSDESIVGTTATTLYEDNRRIIDSLLRPTTYPAGDITTGAKTIMFGLDNQVISPHTGDQAPGTIFAPIMPISAQNTGVTGSPSIQLVYSGNIPAPTSLTDFKSYFVVGDAQSFIRAYVINKKNLKKIFSNSISIVITIPDSANGVLIADTLSEIKPQMFMTQQNVNNISDSNIMLTTGLLYNDYLDDRYPSTETYVQWFRRTRKGDSNVLGLREYTMSGVLPARIPFGFKLKSTGTTVASLLDSITFLDINDTLPSGYF